MTVVALGADHAGFVLKDADKAWLVGRGASVLDFGTDSDESVDYPDFAAAVGRAVTTGQARWGVLVCGTGIGMAIAANKVAGVRAAQCGDVASARISREHNDTNVLALGARTTAPEAALAIVAAWLETEFQGGRHRRRVEKLASLDRGRPPAGGDRQAIVHAQAR